eukprot:3932190-Rhodomonas_salina.1
MMARVVDGGEMSRGKGEAREGRSEPQARCLRSLIGLLRIQRREIRTARTPLIPPPTSLRLPQSLRQSLRRHNLARIWTCGWGATSKANAGVAARRPHLR